MLLRLLGWHGADPADAALLAAAAGFRRMFQLASPAAPGLHAWGAEIEVAAGLAFASGTGTTAAEAFRGCIGEALERAAIDAPDQTLAIRRRAASAWRPRIPGLPARPECIETDAFWAPVDLVLRRAAPEFRPPWPMSSGCAAGPDTAAASLAALLELIERDAAALWWDGGHPPRPVPLEASLAAADAIATLRAGNPGRATWLLDITSDLGVPVLLAASCDAASGKGVCLGFSARLNAAAAARAAVLEMAQMELAHHVVLAKRAERGPAALNPADHAHLARHAALAITTPGLRPQGPPARHRDLADLAALRAALRGAGIAHGLVTLRRGSPAQCNDAVGPRAAAGRYAGVAPVMRALAPLLEAPGATAHGPRFRSAGPAVAQVSLL